MLDVDGQVPNIVFKIAGQVGGTQEEDTFSALESSSWRKFWDIQLFLSEKQPKIRESSRVTQWYI